MKKRRILLISCAVILLCMCIIAGMSYALFSDSRTIQNHLQAGNLSITLTRTNLEYCTLDDTTGRMTLKTNSNSLVLSGQNTGNVFGINDNTLLAPTSYFDAELKIKNGGNVAFSYSVTIHMNGASNPLAEQLIVKVYTIENGSETIVGEKKLSELAGGMSITAGHMDKNAEAQTFHVRVEFPDLENITNNLAQDKTADFDLIVTAVQDTAPTTTPATTTAASTAQ